MEGRRSWLMAYSRFLGRTYWEVAVDGVSVKLGFSTPLHHLIAREEHYGRIEKDMLVSWKNRKGSVVYDIGGYNGLYGLVSAKAYPDASVTIFEPDDTNARHVEENIRLNGLTNCVCVRAAVTDKEGSVFFSQGGRSKEHITDSGTEVRAVTLAKLPPADLIKIDVEGAEGRVLAGLSYAPVILLELHSEEFLHRYGDTEQSIWRTLREKGLSAWLLEKRITERHFLLFKSGEHV